MTNLQINPRKIVQIVILLTIGVVGLMRLQLAITRAFDPDEFAYLHWTWLILHGYLPYRDFFFYIIPGFPWLLSPILWLTGDSINFLIASRVMMFLVYGLCAGMVYSMTRAITIPSKHQNTATPGVWAALLAVLIFLTFPVTIDKTIDIRPDMVMLLLYFGSIMVKNTFLSGIMFGTSFLMFPKIIFGLPALLYLLIPFTHKRFNLVGSNDNFSRPPLANAKGVAFNSLPTWIMGAGIVGLGFLVYLPANNLVPRAIMSITTYSLAVTTGKESFSPLLLLSPYPLIYLTQGGVSLPWAVNTGVWILGMIGLMLLFIHPNQVSSVPDTCPSNKHMGIFWFLFIAGNILFVLLFPVPYVQYLLPLSVAASVLAGLALSVIPDLIRNPTQKYWIPAFAGMTNPIITVITFLFPILLLSSFFLQYRERVMPGAINREQLQVIGDVLRVTRPDESVYDMVGSYVFRTDGYYICCHPYAEFVHKLGSSLPAEVPPGGTKEGPVFNLTKSLIAHQTKFLVMDRVGFVFWKSLDPDKAFLMTNYLPMGDPAKPATPLSKLYSLGQSFRCQLGACVQFDLDENPAATRSTNILAIIAPEKYSITIEPNSSTISIDGKEIHHAQFLDLGTGIHRFTVSSNTLLFRLQLTR